MTFGAVRGFAIYIISRCFQTIKWRATPNELHKMAAFGAMVFLLSGCESIRVLGEPPKPDPTPSMLQECPEELAQILISEDDWKRLDGRDQLQLLINTVTQQWAVEYFKCSFRHNSLVEYLQE